MRSLPASTLAVAIALVLGACAVAQSPSPAASPPGPTAFTWRPSASASAPARASILVGWERGADGVHLLAVHDGMVDRQPLPAVPDGPIAAESNGSLMFLSGQADTPVLWTSRGPFTEATWDSMPLLTSEPLAEPLSWVCAGPGSPPPLAVQSGDNLVYIVGDGGRLRLLPPGLLMLRPGGCAWSDARHLIVPTDVPGPTPHVGFAMFAVEDGTSRLVPGRGGESPSVSDVSLAYIARGPAGQLGVSIGAIPDPDGPMPLPDVRVAPEGGDVNLFRPVLSAEGRLLAVVELVPPAGPRRLLVYEVSADPTLVAALDVSAAIDAGPAWVADGPTR